MQDPVSPGKSVDPVLIFKKIHDQLNNHIPGSRSVTVVVLLGLNLAWSDIKRNRLGSCFGGCPLPGQWLRTKNT